MKTILILLLTATALFAQTKDFQVTEVRENGIMVQEVVIKYVSKSARPSRYVAPEPCPPIVYIGVDDEIHYRSSNYAIGGAASQMGSKMPVMLEGQYFIAKDNSNTFFKIDHKFKARFDMVKTFVKDDKKIELIKVHSYTSFIDTSKKVPVVPSRIMKSPRNKK